MSQPQFPQLSFEQAKAALFEAMAEFEKPENIQKLEAIMVTCGPDPVRKIERGLKTKHILTSCVLISHQILIVCF